MQAAASPIALYPLMSSWVTLLSTLVGRKFLASVASSPLTKPLRVSLPVAALLQFQNGPCLQFVICSSIQSSEDPFATRGVELAKDRWSTGCSSWKSCTGEAAAAPSGLYSTALCRLRYSQYTASAVTPLIRRCLQEAPCVKPQSVGHSKAEAQKQDRSAQQQGVASG